MTYHIFEDLGLDAVTGFKTAAVKAGIKASGNLDVAMIVSDSDCLGSGVFTQNKICAAPVRVCRKVLGTSKRAVIVNAGCANCCTGEQGEESALRMQKETADILGIKPNEVFIASTGVIGEQLPMDKLINGITLAQASLNPKNGKLFAEAILTTDLVAKEFALRVELDDGESITIGGACKGSGMIAPNMATMLGFIATDAKITQEALDKALIDATQKTFNRVTVDSDTSTNDSVFVLASGAAENIIIEIDTPEYHAFYEGFLCLCKELAKKIARDGEGATRLVEVNVIGAMSDADAHLITNTVANSPLVKTAIAGGDPNWGRILGATGRAGAEVDERKLTVSIGSHVVFNKGTPAKDAHAAAPFLKKDPVVITINLGLGGGADTMWTCDFTKKYIEINADYHT